MRILQLIDSLEIGGAERMAVNYANALSHKTTFSGLVATRKEGNLKNQITPEVDYLFLGRKNTLDFNALIRLKTYCRKNRIEYIQAHSSSFFIAVLLKMIHPKIKIIWHDHYGFSDFLVERDVFTIKAGSYFFEGIISVNDQLKNWSQEKLHCNKLIYLPNFTIDVVPETSKTKLKGQAGKRILLLANFRAQKNHFFLIDVAKLLRKIQPNWTFHLVGKDFQDDYSKAVKLAIRNNNLQDTVFIYGAKNDIKNIIAQSDIAVLTSQSEGLPVALLEYAQNKKPVVVTAVGEMPLIVNNGQNGFVIYKEDIDGFCRALETLIENEDLRLRFGNALKLTIREKHSSTAIIDKFLDWLK